MSRPIGSFNSLMQGKSPFHGFQFHQHKPIHDHVRAKSVVNDVTIPLNRNRHFGLHFQGRFLQIIGQNTDSRSPGPKDRWM